MINVGHVRLNFSNIVTSNSTKIGNHSSDEEVSTPKESIYTLTLIQSRMPQNDVSFECN